MSANIWWLFGFLITLIVSIIVASPSVDDLCDCAFGIYAPAVETQHLHIPGCFKEIVSPFNISVNATCHQVDFMSVQIGTCLTEEVQIVIYEGHDCTKNKEYYVETFRPGKCYNISVPGNSTTNLTAKVSRRRLLFPQTSDMYMLVCTVTGRMWRGNVFDVNVIPLSVMCLPAFCLSLKTSKKEFELCMMAPKPCGVLLNRPLGAMLLAIVCLFCAYVPYCIPVSVWSNSAEPSLISELQTHRVRIERYSKRNRTLRIRDRYHGESMAYQYPIPPSLKLHLVDERGDGYQYADNYTVLNPVCHILFPSSIMLLHEHKTGTVLARHIHGIVRDFCGIIYDEPDKRGFHGFHLWLSFRDSAESQTRLQGGSQQNIRMLFWRDPVLTIVSGFNYHMSCTEPWARSTFRYNRFASMAAYFNYSIDVFAVNAAYFQLVETFDLEREPPIWRDRQTEAQRIALQTYGGGNAKKWNKMANGAAKWGTIRQSYLYYLNLLIYQISLKQYGDFYGFPLDFDDSDIHERFNIFIRNQIRNVIPTAFGEYTHFTKWYRLMFGSEETMKYGLFFEMMRYLFAVYPVIYRYHFELISDRGNELKMEVWNTDFGRNLNVLLDRLNLIDSATNRQRLKEHGYAETVNITAQRDTLYALLKRQDASRARQRDNGVREDRHGRFGNRPFFRTLDDDEMRQKPSERKIIYHRRVNKEGDEAVQHEEQRLRVRQKRIEMRQRLNNHRDAHQQHDASAETRRRLIAGRSRFSSFGVKEEHIHTGRNDSKYIEALLTFDAHICLLLKHVTNSIEYGWKYTDYC